MWTLTRKDTRDTTGPNSTAKDQGSSAKPEGAFYSVEDLPEGFDCLKPFQIDSSGKIVQYDGGIPCPLAPTGWGYIVFQ